MPLSTITWTGTDGPTLLLAHATGFHKLVWRPLVTALREHGFAGTIVAHDFRAHGASPKLDTHLWTHFGDDVAEMLRSIEGPVVGVGHSMGGAALLQVALDQPDRFLGQVLIEPIVFPAGAVEQADHPLVVGAARRRRTFDSPGDALANFATKGVFSRWTPEALAAYVEGGLVEEDGQWVLACEPEDEAATFRSSGTDGGFARLGDIQVPVWLVVGAGTDAYPAGFGRVLAEKMHAHLVTVTGAGHFVPMEQPGSLAETIISACASFTAGRSG